MAELLTLKNLFICAYEKNVDELKNVIECLINKEKKDNMSSLMVEKEKKRYDILKDYLDANRNNILHFAIYGNNIDNVKFIITNSNLLNSVNIDEQNGLIISILNRNNDICKYLIEQNINYNQKDKYGANAILYSLITKNYDLFNILIEKKNIDINVNSFDKGNLISICIFERNIKLLKKLFSKNIVPEIKKSIYPHPIIYILYNDNNNNDLLYLYLTYFLFYYTRNEDLYKINLINFDFNNDQICISLDNKQLISTILKNKSYDLNAFNNILNLTDENNTALCDICKNNNNTVGEAILSYYMSDIAQTN
ncbi:conserved protein, unknown function [Hepatocystis sp. ex Piliocolobus tephrosceles]|nr:conserved protein, unknown function [Hepatocystis sp. ex Piliocolobus tephrosceles]